MRNSLSLWERAGVRGAYEIKRLGRYAPLTRAARGLSQRERRLYARQAACSTDAVICGTLSLVSGMISAAALDGCARSRRSRRGVRPGSISTTSGMTLVATRRHPFALWVT